MKLPRLRLIREQHGLTQDELAQRVGMSLSQIHRLEKGSQPNADTLVKLAQALDVSVDYLLGLAEKPNQQTEKKPDPGAQRLLDAYQHGGWRRVLHVLITDEDFKDKEP